MPIVFAPLFKLKDLLKTNKVTINYETFYILIYVNVIYFKKNKC